MKLTIFAETKIDVMRKVLFSLSFFAVALTAFVSCEKENFIIDPVDSEPVDPSSSLIWHFGDVEYLDSITEYNRNGLISRKVWTYDEYGRIVEINEHRTGSSSSGKEVWSYSEGGKKITTINYTVRNDSLIERLKSERTIVAKNDTCTDYYRKEEGKWVLLEQVEGIYDDEGRPLTLISYYSDREFGQKSEFRYDSKGHCTQAYTYYGRGEEWTLTRQVDRSYDERENCIYVKSQSFDINTGIIFGDSIMERSFDMNNRLTSYSLMIRNGDRSSWIGKHKYSLAYDERGNVVENVIYVWDTANNDWQPKDKTSRSYDEKARLISDASYIWQDGKWMGFGFKYEKAYDRNGNLVSDFSYAWDDRENRWTFRSGTTNVFDTDGNMIHTISNDGYGLEEYIWEDGKKIRETRDYTIAGELLSSTRRIEYFDENGRDTLIEEYHRYKEGEWEKFEKVKYSYDNNGKQINGMTYRFENGEWALSNGFKYEVTVEGNTETRQKYTWNSFYKRWDEIPNDEVRTYDEAGRIKMILTRMKVWDNATDTHWENDEKTEYYYDSYGNNIGYQICDWYESEKQWIYRSKEEYVFDAAGNQTSEAHYMYDAAHSEWMGGLMWQAEYDDLGNQILLISYNFGYSNPSFKTVSLYDEMGVLLERATYDMTYRDGVWDWQGNKRTIYTFDPDTETHMEFNLTFNRTTQSWEGNRTDRETDAQGNLISEILYKWDNEQWFKSSETKYDSRGNMVSDCKYGKADGVVACLEMAYKYDSKNRLVETLRIYNGEVLYGQNVSYSVHKDIKVIDGINF